MQIVCVQTTVSVLYLEQSQDRAHAYIAAYLAQLEVARDGACSDAAMYLVELPAHLRIFPGETSEEREMTLVAQADSAIREIEEVLFPRG